MREGFFVTSMCQEFCRQGRGVYASMQWAGGCTPQSATPKQTPHGQTPPGRADTAHEIATQVDGTHPTERHYCWVTV